MAQRKNKDRPSRHAQSVGSPGAWARFAGFVRAIWPLFGVAVAFGYLLRAAFPFPVLPATAIGLGFLMLAGALAAALADGERRMTHFTQGAEGEEAVARELAFLPAGYHVFHGVHTGRGRIGHTVEADHVVVGPTGLFLVETKNWTGRIAVSDGRVTYDGIDPDRDPVAQTREVAAALHRRLREELDHELTIQPVLCFVGPVEGGLQGCNGLVVCSLKDLNQVILDPRHEVLDPAAVEPVAAALANMTGR